MSRARLVAIASALGAACAVAAACVSDGSNAAQGGQGQACYPNGTCSNQLSCVSGTCVQLGPDGKPVDAGNGGAGTTSCGTITPLPRACFVAGMQACPLEPDAATCESTAECPTNTTMFSCGTNADCHGGAVCCAKFGQAPDAGRCTVAVASDSMLTGVECSSDCTQDVDHPVCASNLDCTPPQYCAPFTAPNGAPLGGVCISP